jgi:ornithine carbamoyltransferase
VKIKSRRLLSFRDVEDAEVLGLLDLAAELKEKKRRGVRGNLLERRNIALVFEKMSTRTRCAAAVAAADEGGRTEYLAASDIHLGTKESVKDTARVLGRMFDGILFRGYRQRTVELLSEFSGLPVWNGLTDESHPTQALADLLTIRETFGGLRGVKVVYVGDGRNNVANSLMFACAKAGADMVNCTPRELSPEPGVLGAAQAIARRNGCVAQVSHDPIAGVAGANVVYTDVWASMGEETKLAERIRLLRPFQVDMAMMERTGNLGAGKAIFLHCLPALHDYETDVTQQTGALEVTDDVFESGFSKVFDEAENRVHTIKAVMVASL